MDERLSGWEDRLRHELDAAVGEVRADDDLVVAVRAGGRRRLRRRRALVSLPAAAVVAGGAVWAGAGRSAPPPVEPAQSAAQAPRTAAQDTPTSLPGPVPDAGPTAPDAQNDMTRVDAFFAAGYTYDDAVTLGETWNVDTWEAKVTGGQKLMAGETLPFAP
ncbi:hypothetical protein [Kineococcus aurantiacus]|uniref:Uncharacterized protein n=1 Tax=Kineococcus aurantiacus TaxID=37633 RepID=A0A7Y9DKV6_9ACTN|nr:hypothetical protein [Kineococcus aurantiacus]NYD22473.1 hypothetical protein [Kineococcus aurantiacus]